MDKNEYFADVGKYREDIDKMQIWLRRGVIAAIIFSLAFSIVQIFCMMSEYEKEKGIEIWTQFEDWYEFKPNSKIASEALKRYGSAATSVMLENEEKVYTEYLAKWVKRSGVDILYFSLQTVFKKDDIRVYSYKNSEAYDMAWDEFTLPLSEGRWFEGVENELICVQGDDYEIGDIIKIDEKDGGFFLATVVGKTRYPYLPSNILSVSNGIHNSLYTPQDDLEIFLLNPRSGHNEKSDRTSYSATIIRTSDEKFIQKNSEYGTFSSIERSLQNDKAVYVIPAIELGLGIIILAVFFGIAVYIQEDKWMLLWIWLGGIVGGFSGALLYFDARYKVLVVFALCSVLSLIWWGVHKYVSRKVTVDVMEMEVIVLQKDEE